MLLQQACPRPLCAAIAKYCAIYALLFLQNPFAQAWTPALNLTRGAADAGSGVVTVDSNGRIHLLVGRSGQQLWSLRVENQVRTDWSVLVGNGGVNPSLAADGLGRVHAVYSRDYEVQYQQWDNGNWSAPLTVSSGAGGVGKCQVRVDANNNLHVTWGANSQVYYRRRAASGAWDPVEQVAGADDLEFYFSPRMALVGNAPVIVYGKHNGGNWNAWFASRESGTWSTMRLDANAGCSNGDIAVTSEGTITAGWDQGYDVYSMRRVNGIWEPRYPLRVGGNDSLGPRFSAGTGSIFQAVWLESSDILASQFNGSTWSAPVSVTGGVGGVGEDMARDSSGRQFVSWSKNWDMWVSASTSLPDPAPPPVNGATIASASSRLTLSWVNPSAYDLASVRIVWRTDRAPAGPADGTIVLDRAASWGSDSYVHSGISNGITHYYGLYVVDTTGQPSSLLMLSGRPTLKQDFDKDGDVDQSDFGHMQRCLTGPLGGITAACSDADFNNDAAITATDLDGFLACFSPADVLPADGCSPF